MRTREITFGELTLPLHQRRLRTIKGEATQSRWVVIACRDSAFDLAVFVAPNFNAGDEIELISSRSYSELWSVLADLLIGQRKFWCIGWRMHYAMDRADFTAALASGLVQLPHTKTGKGKQRHTGKLTYNKRIFEVDVVCGRNKFKMLDWINYGIDLDPALASHNSVDLHTARAALRDFLAVAEVADVSVCKPTAAQLGWNHCRRITKTNILHANLDVDTRALERRAYHGGRNEAFRLGDIPGTSYSLDVRSCYAAICRDELLPCECIGEYRAGIEVDKIDKSGVYHWIADVAIKTEQPDYPVKWQGTPIYPVGEFVTALAWPELQRALRMGHVKQVLAARRYAIDCVMTDYAEWYLQKRAAIGEGSVNPMCGFIKSMFNASLGYTAREKYDWVPWHCQIGHRYWLGTTVSPDDYSSSVAAQVLDGERRWLRISGEPFEAMPYLHATICSYARVRLLDVFERAGRENVLYCDTDGILCTRAGWEALESQAGMLGNMPGQLVERFPCGPARVQGQKSYRIGNNFIQSGVTKTRYSVLVEKHELTVQTGRADSEGRVWPFQMRCEPPKGKGGKWVNVLL